MSFLLTDFNTRDVFELTLTFATKYTSVNILFQPPVSVKLDTTHFKSPSILNIFNMFFLTLCSHNQNMHEIFYIYFKKDFDTSIVIKKHIQTNERGNLLVLNQRTIIQSMPVELRDTIYKTEL